MTDTNHLIPHTEDSPRESSIEEELSGLNARLDMLGQQMNWLCENLQSLFLFVNEMGSSGGGLRGMISALKKSHAPIPSELFAEIEGQQP